MSAELIMIALKHGPLSVSRLVAQTGVSETTVRTHLKRLIDEGKITTVKKGQTTEFKLAKAKPVVPETPVAPPLPTPPTGRKGAVKEKKPRPPRSDGEMSKRRRLAGERDEQVKAFLAAHPSGLNRKSLSGAMDVDYDLLYISLWRLERDGVVTKVRDGSRAPVWRLVSASSEEGTTPPPATD